jgi:hypothetical protein
MLSAATRSDVQGMVEGVKNTLLDRLAPRNYVQALAESVRGSILQNLQELHAENQQMIRSGQTQREQLSQRIGAIEGEIKVVRQLLNQVLEQQARIMNRFAR